jgi:[acyl-carrier-protein] S-malonyltransferase
MPVRAFVFPGQGSQAVGMGQDLARAFAPARQVFEEVDEALRSSLSRLMWEGPAETLTLTENAQPALLAVSIAVIRTLSREGGLDLAKHAKFVAGHSLGEYCALAAAGTFELADAARLLRLRGQAMQKAVPAGDGAMAALLGAELELARAIAAEAAEEQVCSVANDNGGGQVVLSGHAEAIERAIGLAPARGVKRAMRLPVSAPFHCALMAPAAEVMAGALAQVAMAPPAVPVVANVTAEPTADPIEIRGQLVEQVTALVRWRESVLAMKRDGVDTLVECGAGKVLAGLARRIDSELAAVSVGTPADVDAFLKTL